MKKKELNKIVVPELTQEQKDLLLLNGQKDYLLRTQLEQGVKLTLVLNLYENEEQHVKLKFRVFCQKDGFITQDFSEKGMKWRTAKISYLLQDRCDFCENWWAVVMATTMDDYSRVLEFMGKFKETDEEPERLPLHAEFTTERSLRTIGQLIEVYQEVLRMRALREKHEKEKREIDRYMRKFGNLPRGYDTFVRDVVFQEEDFMFYSRKLRRAQCTKCGSQFELLRNGQLKRGSTIAGITIKRSERVVCPVCRKRVICRSEGYGLGSLCFQHWSVAIQHCGEDVLVRYFLHTKDMRKGYKDAEFTFTEYLRSIHCRDDSLYFRLGDFKMTGEYRWCSTDSMFGCTQLFMQRVYSPKNVAIYKNGIRKVLANTCMRYSGIEWFLRDCKQIRAYPRVVDDYFSAYRMYPVIEQLSKSGFCHMVSEFFRSYDYPEYVFYEGTTIVQKLGISERHYKMLLRVEEAGLKDVTLLREHPDLSESDFFELKRFQSMREFVSNERYIQIIKYAPLKRVREYFELQGITHHSDYLDYVEWSEFLGRNIKEKNNLFPRQFKRTHDKRYKEYTARKKKEFATACEKFNGILSQMPASVLSELEKLHDNGLFARLPVALEELVAEGDNLSHCVGTFIEKMAYGESIIFFVRREETPDKSFYTLEWRAGKVVQCRGRSNAAMTKEVQDFVFKSRSGFEKVADALSRELSAA